MRKLNITSFNFSVVTWLSVMSIVVIAVCTVLVLQTKIDARPKKPIIFTSSLPLKVLVQSVVGNEYDVYAPFNGYKHDHAFSSFPQQDIPKIRKSSLVVYFSSASENLIYRVAKQGNLNRLEILETPLAKRELSESARIDAKIRKQQEKQFKASKVTNNSLPKHASNHAQENVKDPHFWMSPRSTAFVLECIGEKLISMVKNKQLAKERYNAMLMELKQMDSEAMVLFNGKQFKRITFSLHSGLSYLANAYNLSVVELLTATGSVNSLAMSKMYGFLGLGHSVCIIVSGSHHDEFASVIQKIVEKSGRNGAKVATTDTDAVAFQDHYDEKLLTPAHLYRRFFNKNNTEIYKCMFD